MSDTLILLFHPDLSRSQANAALADAVADLPGLEIVDMYRLYPTGLIDVAAEVGRLLAARRVVLQFPVHWYAPPALLQQWKDAVLTRMYYLANETEGKHFAGTPLLVAATAGNGEESYRASGMNLFPLAELLRPLQAMAQRCGLPWSPPFLLYLANKLDAPALAEAGRRYHRELVDWVGRTTTRSSAASCLAG